MNINFPRITEVIKSENTYNNQKDKQKKQQDDILNNKDKKKTSTSTKSNKTISTNNHNTRCHSDIESSGKIKLDDYA